jgi:hypothetical protein
MTRTFSFKGLFLIASAISPSCYGQAIQWGSCNGTGFKSPITIECADYLVPLDYTDANSTTKLKLELLRVPTIVKPSKGSILFNFGGPGEPGRRDLATLGPLFQQ